MTAQRLNENIQKILIEAIQQGVGTGQMDMSQIIGVLEINKAEMIKANNILVAQRIAANAPKITPVNGSIPKFPPRG